MSSEPERWSIHELDDTTLNPPPDRWTGQGRTSAGIKVAGALCLVGLALVGSVFAFAVMRTGPLAPGDAPAPTFSRNDSGTPLPSEGAVWGDVWSRAKGIVALRPTWLPNSTHEHQASLASATSRDGFVEYSVWYVELRSAPGAIVASIRFLAESLDGGGGGFVQFTGAPETVTVRGHEGQLSGNGSPGWVLLWTEGNSRYVIEAFAVSRDDLLRIAESLAPVIDEKGETR